MIDIRHGECHAVTDKKSVTGNFVSCGRTEKRGNWVKIQRGDFSVRLDDDCKNPISQITLKEFCIDILNYLNIF